jgi:hypothetical protein
MLKTICEYIFIAISIVLALYIIYGKFFVFKKKDAVYVSDYCSGIAVSFSLYVIFAFLCVFFQPSLHGKFLMMALGVSPFLLGFLANYYTEKYFTILQILLLCFGIYYIW